MKPGTHTQFVALSVTDLETAHFYIHVSGDPEKWEPVLLGRRSRHRPRATPLSRSARSTTCRSRYRYTTNWPLSRRAGATKTRPRSTDGVYRPEMRFSVLDLEGPKLLRTGATGQTDDILDDKIPAISWSSGLFASPIA